MGFTVTTLDTSTWDAFAELVERNNGVFGGCWCVGFHPEGREKGIDRRAVKQQRVECGSTHSALVLDDAGVAQGSLGGALDQIARAGGGLVEAIPEVTEGREPHGRFLYTATVELFEDFGFSRRRQVGKHAWIVDKDVEASP